MENVPSLKIYENGNHIKQPLSSDLMNTFFSQTAHPLPHSLSRFSFGIFLKLLRFRREIGPCQISVGEKTVMNSNIILLSLMIFNIYSIVALIYIRFSLSAINIIFIQAVFGLFNLILVFFTEFWFLMQMHGLESYFCVHRIIRFAPKKMYQ